MPATAVHPVPTAAPGPCHSRRPVVPLPRTDTLRLVPPVAATEPAAVPATGLAVVESAALSDTGRVRTRQPGRPSERRARARRRRRRRGRGRWQHRLGGRRGGAGRPRRRTAVLRRAGHPDRARRPDRSAISPPPPPACAGWRRPSPPQPCCRAARELAVAHVGDSRLYRMRRGSLERLTEDHTLGAELDRLDRGETDGRAARSLSHVLTRAVGLAERATPDVAHACAAGRRPLPHLQRRADHPPRRRRARAGNLGGPRTAAARWPAGSSPPPTPGAAATTSPWRCSASAPAWPDADGLRPADDGRAGARCASRPPTRIGSRPASVPCDERISAMARPTSPFAQAARRIMAVTLLGAVTAAAATGCGSQQTGLLRPAGGLRHVDQQPGRRQPDPAGHRRPDQEHREGPDERRQADRRREVRLPRPDQGIEGLPQRPERIAQGAQGPRAAARRRSRSCPPRRPRWTPRRRTSTRPSRTSATDRGGAGRSEPGRRPVNVSPGRRRSFECATALLSLP